MREKPEVLEKSPKGDSQSNGRVEKAVRDIEEQVRTLRSCLEVDLGARLPVMHPVMAWLVEASADCINRFRKVRENTTPLERIRGQHQPKKMADFGECVKYLPAKDYKDTSNKAGEKFKEGVWLGLSSRSREIIIGTDDGIEMARKVCRKVEWEAFDKTKILAIRSPPWDRKALRQTTPHLASDQIPVPREYQKEPPGNDARRTYIYRQDIEAAGVTERCPGGKAIIQNKVAQKHSEECRAKVEAYLATTEEGKARLDAAARRITSAQDRMEETSERAQASERWRRISSSARGGSSP